MASTISFPLLALFLSLFLTGTWASDMSIISYDEKTGVKSGPGLRSDDEVMSMYESWMVKHGKAYNTLGEKEKRFDIFKDNLRYVDEQNAVGNRTYKLGLNRFADISNAEYRNTYLGTRTRPERRLGTVSDRYQPKVGEDLPDSVDWREKGAVAPIKDQGSCGSCWAFSTIVGVEGINQIVTGELISLSEQELVDCDTSYDQGCNGGLMDYAYQFIIKNGGIDSEEDYPYKGTDGKCDQHRKNAKVVSIDSYEDVPTYNEKALKKAVANQPVSIAIEAGGWDFQLYESGFAHSAFALGYEAGINKSTIDGNLVPPGALVTFIQKGIQYLELEANSSNDDLDTDEDFQFLNPLDLITKDVLELQKIVKEKKETKRKEKSKGKEKDITEKGREHGHGIPMEKEKELAKEKDNEKQPREKEKIEKEKDKATGKEKEKPLESASVANPSGDEFNGGLEENATDIGPEPMDIYTSVDTLSYEISSSDITVLQGHTSEVFACAYNPVGSFLASGSGDSTARIWTIDVPSSSSMQNGSHNVVLRHFKGRTNEKSKDVTTLDWNVDGALLATGSYDGQARIWSRDGKRNLYG